MTRPKLCPDQNCTPLVQIEGDDWLEKGGSMDCLGKRDKPFVYQFREVAHTNDLNHCLFLPHGIYCLKENAGDLANLASFYLRALRETGQHVFNLGWFLRTHIEIDKRGMLHVNDARRGKWHCCWHHGTCTRNLDAECNGTWEERDKCSLWAEADKNE
jgi:hypothetical protein